MKVEIWDNRRCQVGEGPVAIGKNHNDIWWVDIYNSKVLYKNADTGATDEYLMPEHVGFIIPCADGSDILGTANGPVRRRKDGTVEKLQTRTEVNGKADTFPERWNDAKVAPDGHLWLGSMPYDWAKYPAACGLYKLDKDTLKLTKEVDGINLSNGLAWSANGKTMYYVDTMAKSIDTFDYNNGNVSNRQVRWRITDDSQGLPDGMCIDKEDGIWVAFWSGAVIRRFDKNFNITDEIRMPVPMPTSCAFIGPNFEQMIITTAHDGIADAGEDWGKTYICTPKISGVAPTLFPN